MCVCVLCTFGGHADPVEVTGEFFRNVSLASSRQAHHHNDGGGIGEMGRAGRCREGWVIQYVVKTVPVYKTTLI